MILVIRTDSKDAYVGIWQDGKELTGETWEAGKDLSNQLLRKIKASCEKITTVIEDIKGVVVYEGPGSYTGLRIGISVANSIAYANDVAVVGSTGDDWINTGLKSLEKAKTEKYVSPQYGGQPHITKQKK